MTHTFLEKFMPNLIWFNNNNSYTALYPVKIYKHVLLYIINIKICLTIKKGTSTINAYINIKTTKKMHDGYFWVNHPIPSCVYYMSQPWMSQDCVQYKLQPTTFEEIVPHLRWKSIKHCRSPSSNYTPLTACPPGTCITLICITLICHTWLTAHIVWQAYKPQSMFNRLALDEPITHKGPLISRVVLTQACIK